MTIPHVQNHYLGLREAIMIYDTLSYILVYSYMRPFIFIWESVDVMMLSSVGSWMSRYIV